MRRQKLAVVIVLVFLMPLGSSRISLVDKIQGIQTHHARREFGTGISLGI